MAVVHAAGQVVIALAQSRTPGSDPVITAAVLGTVVGAGVLWAGVDGWRRLPSPAQTWLLAAFLAGVLAGPLAVLLQGVLVDSTGLESLDDALVGGTFTVLLVLGSAALGVPAGRLLDQPRAADRSG
jgi:phosphate/sulfate permease